MSDLTRSCCGQDMEEKERERADDGVLWAFLECQICDHVEWVCDFKPIQRGFFDACFTPETTVDALAAAVGAFG